MSLCGPRRKRDILKITLRVFGFDFKNALSETEEQTLINLQNYDDRRRRCYVTEVEFPSPCPSSQAIIISPRETHILFFGFLYVCKENSWKNAKKIPNKPPYIKIVQVS